MINSFPEALFQPSKANLEEYILRLEVGELKARKSTVAICALARDLGGLVKLTTSRIEKIGEMFNDYSVFVVENDSKDGTKDFLNGWSKKNSKVKISIENFGRIRHEQTHDLQRRADMAFYRNTYLNMLRDSGFPYDYVIILDSDLVGGYSYEGVAHTLSFDYDVVGSNSIFYRETTKDVYHRLYFDSWAFRKLNQEFAHKDSEINVLTFNRGERPFMVNSCFGGLAVYKGHLMLNNDFWYDSSDCDHPTIHKKMRAKGHKVYLNPSQITLYNPTIYTGGIEP